MSHTPIDWDRPTLARFKLAYHAAWANGAGPDDTFRFEGNEFVLSFAKYVIEYLERALPAELE